jgi:RimJ/RimL family protein N-acetyltransferase
MMKSKRSAHHLTAQHIQRCDERHLRDGRTVWIRPIQAEDAMPIAGTFHLLHEDEIRKRFLHPIKALSNNYLQQLSHCIPGQRFAIVVSEPYPSGTALIGAVARLAKDDARNTAEFGILVSHFISGQGLGRVLMLRLIDWCRFYRIDTLWGDVMDDNVAMLTLAEHLGFSREARHTTPGITRIVMNFKS